LGSCAVPRAVFSGVFSAVPDNFVAEPLLPAFFAEDGCAAAREAAFAALVLLPGRRGGMGIAAISVRASRSPTHLRLLAQETGTGALHGAVFLRRCRAFCRYPHF